MVSRVLTLCLFLLEHLHCSIASETPLGHMQPLGKQRSPEGHIEIRDSVPTGDEFFEKYVLPGKPVVFKGAGKEIPAFRLWTDEYLKEKFGSLVGVAEEGKKENRSMRTFRFSMEEFVNKYKLEDIYMVHSIPQKMRDDISLLPCISCGGYTNVLQDVVLWFSSGGTKSVFHSDGVDNINCLLSGTKDLYMVDKSYEEEAHIDVRDGGYSSVDVDAVNVTKYPNFPKLPWYEAHMEPGDCLFIPFRWLHQVRSFGRNIAVNVWFNHISRVDTADCQKDEKKNKYLPMTNVQLKPLDGPRNLLLIELEAKKNKLLSKKDFVNILKGTGADMSLKTFRMVWKLFDQNEDDKISKDELLGLRSEDLKAFNNLMPMYNSQEDDDEEAEDDEEEELFGRPSLEEQEREGWEGDDGEEPNDDNQKEEEEGDETRKQNQSSKDEL